MMALGCISQKQFQGEILGIGNFSKAVGDGIWSIKYPSGDSEDGYLCSHQTRVCLCKDKMTDTDDEVVPLVEAEQDPSVLDLPGTAGSTACTYEYHIVYSLSYGVPVLYFNAYKSDGRLLSLDEVWRNVPQCYQDQLDKEKWTFITQQEHPLLGRPFFQIHPCNTASLMKQVPQTPRNYVVSWLSVVGPVVGLNLPLCYSEIG